MSRPVRLATGTKIRLGAWPDAPELEVLQGPSAPMLAWALRAGERYLPIPESPVGLRSDQGRLVRTDDGSAQAWAGPSGVTIREGDDVAELSENQTHRVCGAEVVAVRVAQGQRTRFRVQLTLRHGPGGEPQVDLCAGGDIVRLTGNKARLFIALWEGPELGVASSDLAAVVPGESKTRASTPIERIRAETTELVGEEGGVLAREDAGRSTRYRVRDRDRFDVDDQRHALRVVATAELVVFVYGPHTAAIEGDDAKRLVPVLQGGVDLDKEWMNRINGALASARVREVLTWTDSACEAVRHEGDAWDLPPTPDQARLAFAFIGGKLVAVYWCGASVRVLRDGEAQAARRLASDRNAKSFTPEPLGCPWAERAEAGWRIRVRRENVFGL